MVFFHFVQLLLLRVGYAMPSQYCWCCYSGCCCCCCCRHCLLSTFFWALNLNQSTRITTNRQPYTHTHAMYIVKCVCMHTRRPTNRSRTGTTRALTSICRYLCQCNCIYLYYVKFVGQRRFVREFTITIKTRITNFGSSMCTRGMKMSYNNNNNNS